MPQVELTAQPQIETDLRKQLRLARIRLRLALLTMAIVPVALSLVLFKAVVDARYGTIALGIVAAMICLTLVSVVLTVWMARRIVQPAGLAPRTVDARGTNEAGASRTRCAMRSRAWATIARSRRSSTASWTGTRATTCRLR